MKPSAIVPCLLAALIGTLLCLGCSHEDPAPEPTAHGTPVTEEFIILSRARSGHDDRMYFQAIEIHTLSATPIVGILETGGRTYLPTMSSLPECQHKVVAGHLSGDTLFVTERILRDTTVSTVGR